MHEYIVLSPSNLKETAARTDVSFETLRHLYLSSEERDNQYVLFKLGEDQAKWNGIEIAGEISVEWVVRNITKLEE